MKILVLSNLYPPDFLGGYELGCRQAVEALRVAGHDVRVVTAAPRHAVSFAEASHVRRRFRLTDLYDDHTQMNTRPAFHGSRYLDAHGLNASNVHALLNEITEFEPDVAYVWNLIGLGGLGLLAALQHVGLPWVMHLMDVVPLKLCEVVPNARLPELQRGFESLCRGRFIACSRTLLREIATGGLNLSARTTLLPNWVTGAPPAKPRRYRPDGVLRIVCAGTLATNKGTDILIHAAAELRERGQDEFQLDLFGHCTDSSFETLIQGHDLSEHVRYRGVCDQAELLLRYDHYDAFVFPTVEREPFGFAPMEAAFRGCVPVVSSLCGFSEWFVDGLDCLKIERTPESIADALESLMTGEVRLADLGRRASRIVARDFHIDTLRPKIERELRHALRDQVAPRHSPEEAYRIAILAERSLYCLQQERAA